MKKTRKKRQPRKKTVHVIDAKTTVRDELQARKDLVGFLVKRF